MCWAEAVIVGSLGGMAVVVSCSFDLTLDLHPGPSPLTYNAMPTPHNTGAAKRASC